MVAVGWGLRRMSREHWGPRRTTKETYRVEGGPLLQGRTRREGIDGGKVQGEGGRWWPCVGGYTARLMSIETLAEL